MSPFYLKYSSFDIFIFHHEYSTEYSIFQNIKIKSCDTGAWSLTRLFIELNTLKLVLADSSNRGRVDFIFFIGGGMDPL